MGAAGEAPAAPKDAKPKQGAKPKQEAKVAQQAKPKLEAKPKQDAKGKKEKGGKNTAGTPATESPAEPTSEELEILRQKKLKKVAKEGGKRGVEIEGAADMGGLQFFCTSVDEPEGDLEFLDVCMRSMNEKSDPTDEERKGGSGHIGKMIFSAGAEQLGIVAYIPDEMKSKIDAVEWIKVVLALFGGELAPGGTGTYAKGFVKADTNKNKFPLKMKEPSITEGIQFLKKAGLFPDQDSDSDEMVFGDDDFPS